MRPLLLDLYCGAGGAAKGYHDAGFDVIGVDHHAQPNYPFEYVQMDVLDFLGADFQKLYPVRAIHASPPCQAHSKMSGCRPGLADSYEALIEPTREELERIGLPYVIENVPGAPLKNPVELCGFMFGRRLYRHRWFEASFELSAPPHPAHDVPASKAGHWQPGTIISIAGHIAPIRLAREVMEIGWTNREELAEAIPPYYTAHVGHQLMEVLNGH